MSIYLRNRITAVWVLLVGATLLSWAMGHGAGFSDPRHAGLAIILVAFVKVRFVFMDFMEVRHAPLSLRSLVDAWIILVCLAVLAVYWSSGDPVSVAGWPRVPGL